MIDILNIVDCAIIRINEKRTNSLLNGFFLEKAQSIESNGDNVWSETIRNMFCNKHALTMPLATTAR